MADAMRANVAQLLRGIDRYNPENLQTLERYVDMQARENVYDVEANLAVLKLYQFNPSFFQTSVTATILLKSLTNLPHTDFTLCKCLIDGMKLEEESLARIIELADMLETCNFRHFWVAVQNDPDMILSIKGFEDSIRKFICHVVAITYQTINKEVLAELLGGLTDSPLQHWINKYGWKETTSGEIFINNQEDNIKTKNITEKITFESVAGIMASAQQIQR